MSKFGISKPSKFRKRRGVSKNIPTKGRRREAEGGRTTVCPVCGYCPIET